MRPVSCPNLLAAEQVSEPLHDNHPSPTHDNNYAKTYNLDKANSKFAPSQ